MALLDVFGKDTPDSQDQCANCGAWNPPKFKRCKSCGATGKRSSIKTNPHPWMQRIQILNAFYTLCLKIRAEESTEEDLFDFAISVEKITPRWFDFMMNLDWTPGTSTRRRPDLDAAIRSWHPASDIFFKVPIAAERIAETFKGKIRSLHEETVPDKGIWPFVPAKLPKPFEPIGLEFAAHPVAAVIANRFDHAGAYVGIWADEDESVCLIEGPPRKMGSARYREFQAVVESMFMGYEPAVHSNLHMFLVSELFHDVSRLAAQTGIDGAEELLEQLHTESEFRHGYDVVTSPGASEAQFDLVLTFFDSAESDISDVMREAQVQDGEFWMD